MYPMTENSPRLHNSELQRTFDTAELLDVGSVLTLVTKGSRVDLLKNYVN